MFAPTLIEASVAATLDTNMLVANSMTFTQTDDLGIFLLDESQTFGDPDPPKLGQTVNFTLGGLWT